MGDQYHGPVVGWKGNGTRVGGVIVSKPFFASGRYDVVMKIGTTEPAAGGPEDSNHPIGMVPAIWTYAYRDVEPDASAPDDFSRSSPLFNPKTGTEYSSEIDMPEFGKGQDFTSAMYTTYLNSNTETRTFSSGDAADGKYHTYTSIWHTHLVALDGVTDSQVARVSRILVGSGQVDPLRHIQRKSIKTAR